VLKLKLVTLLLPEAYLEGIDTLVKRDLYPSRSGAIRLAVQDLLRRELWRMEGEVAKKEAVTASKGRVRHHHGAITQR